MSCLWVGQAAGRRGAKVRQARDGIDAYILPAYISGIARLAMPKLCKSCSYPPGHLAGA